MVSSNKTTKQWQGIWVIAEQIDGALNTVIFELLGKAQEIKKTLRLEEPVTAVLIGDGVESHVPSLAGYGAENIIVIDHPALRLFQNETYALILEELVVNQQPSIILMGATATGADLAPTLGAKLKTGVAAHCADARVKEDGCLISIVPAFGGKVLGDILCPNHRPQIASFKPGVLTKAIFDEKAEYKLLKYDPSEALLCDTGRVKALEFVREELVGKPLEEAEIIIAGGWGMESEENWSLLEKIANLLGGAVGCTRPAVDEGWAHERQMIGTSGRTVRPKIYLGAAISGATHHICGMKDTGFIISINKDEKAPIFEVSDLGVVGDAKTILTALYEEICKVSHNQK